MTNNKIWAIVPAAGVGERMGADIPKQYLKINGLTLLEITLGVILENKNIDQLVVCIATNDDHWSTLGVSKSPKIKQTDGGASRAISVMNGLSHIKNVAADDDWVLVHDAARPCLDQELLNKLINELRGGAVGGILAFPAKDTLKIADSNGKHIIKTLDRSLVWHAQTPQMFRYGLLKQALQDSLKKNNNVTDEAIAMEHAGHQIKLVKGSMTNLKVTDNEDLQMASFLLGANRS